MCQLLFAMCVFVRVCCQCFEFWWSSHLVWISVEAPLVFMGLFSLIVLKTDTVHTLTHSYTLLHTHKHTCTPDRSPLILTKCCIMTHTSGIMSVYYNLRFIFLVLAFIPGCNSYTALSGLIYEIWELCNIPKKTSDTRVNKRSQTIRALSSELFTLFVKKKTKENYKTLNQSVTWFIFNPQHPFLCEVRNYCGFVVQKIVNFYKTRIFL